MKKTSVLFFIFSTLLCAFLLPYKSFAVNYSMERIFYMSQGKEKQGIASLESNTDKIDILAPQFYGFPPN